MCHAVQTLKGWLKVESSGPIWDAQDPTEFDTTLEALEAVHNAVKQTGNCPAFKIVPVLSIVSKIRKDQPNGQHKG